VRVTKHWGAFAKPLLLCKSRKYYIFWMCVCSLSYPACKVHALYYYIICGLPGCALFVYIISWTTPLRKKLLNVKLCVDIIYNFKVCRSVRLHIFKWINHPDAALLPPRSYGKPEAAAAVDRLLMMGIRMPETCWAVFKRQAINL
jgi:hypothetical protein